MSNSLRIDRRDLLRTMGTAAVGMTLLDHAVAAQDTPGAQVLDRASSIRITAMKTYWVEPIVYVKIETNHGIVGWGDLKGTDVRVGKVLAESLFELLDGENPTRIEHLWQKMFRAHRDIRGGAIMIHAMAANPKLTGMCEPLYDHRDWLWTFLDVEGVEPTNNVSERALRPAVIWRKLSFGTQSAAGSRFVETILTVVETCHRQSRNSFEFLTATMQAHFSAQPGQSLLSGV